MWIWQQIHSDFAAEKKYHKKRTVRQATRSKQAKQVKSVPLILMAGMVNTGAGKQKCQLVR